jgi:hypothetical protein
MRENNTATITLANEQQVLKLAWNQYDGDDCFESHIVEYTDPETRIAHNYKQCHVRSPRIITEILHSNAGEKGFGFRVPEIVYYDVKLHNGKFSYHAYSDELPREFAIAIDSFTSTIEQSWKKYWDNGG